MDNSLNYSTWVRNLSDQHRGNGNLPMGSFKIKRLAPSNKPSSEEKKSGENDQNAKGDQILEMERSQDYLLNYTFDLSLDEHMQGSPDNPRGSLQARSNKISLNHITDDLSETKDQFDILVEEFNDFFQ